MIWVFFTSFLLTLYVVQFISFRTQLRRKVCPGCARRRESTDDLKLTPEAERLLYRADDDDPGSCILVDAFRARPFKVPEEILLKRDLKEFDKYHMNGESTLPPDTDHEEPCRGCGAMGSHCFTGCPIPQANEDDGA